MKSSSQQVARRVCGPSPVAVVGVLAVLFLVPPWAQAQFGLEKGKVLSLEGRVSIERAGELWILKPGQALSAGAVIVSGPDGLAQLELPDHSLIEVFPNSRLVLQPSRFNWDDLLDLYLGKVKLYIRRLTQEGPSYRVTSPTAVISIRGTVLEVEVGASQETVVHVESGSVSVRHRLLPGREVLVEDGQSLQVLPDTPLATVKWTAPLVVVGRIVQIVVDTAARVEQMANRSGGGKSAGTGGGSSPGPSSGDAGSNEPAPPPGEDDSSAPPGDVVPP